MEIQPMTDEQRKAIALEYFKRVDRGESIVDLFDDHAQLYFPKWGLATGKKEIEKLFSELIEVLAEIKHDMVYANIIQQREYVIVEGTSNGKTKNGIEWRAGLSHAGRFCNVFEIRDFKIQRCFIYLDPDYEGADTARYPWLAKDEKRNF